MAQHKKLRDRISKSLPILMTPDLMHHIEAHVVSGPLSSDHSAAIARHNGPGCYFPQNNSGSKLISALVLLGEVAH
jgi:hypothetical protein